MNIGQFVNNNKVCKVSTLLSFCVQFHTAEIISVSFKYWAEPGALWNSTSLESDGYKYVIILRFLSDLIVSGVTSPLKPKPLLLHLLAQSSFVFVWKSFNFEQFV